MHDPPNRLFRGCMSDDPSFPASPPPELPAAARRRRRVTASGTGPEDPARAARASCAAYAGMVLIGTYGLFAAGSPPAILQGGMWIAFGLLVLCFPPRVKVSWIWILAGTLMLAGASMAFLPAAWFGIPEWRTALEALGQSTGSQVTVQPRLTAEVLGKLAVSVMAAWFLLGHRVSDGAHLGFALLVALGISSYAVVSMVAYDQSPLWGWDPGPDFGLFPNRNHTASILVVGSLCGLGVLREAVRLKRGGIAGMATLTIVIGVWGLLGFSVSRAGVLLLVLGALLWLSGLGASGGRYLSRRVLFTVLGFALAGGAIFWGTDNSLRQRLEETWAKMEAPSRPDLPTAADAAASGPRDSAFDFRFPIYQDTWSMLAREPLTGVGLGQFPAIFPQYREHSAILAKCWHFFGGIDGAVARHVCCARSSYGDCLAGASAAGSYFSSRGRPIRSFGSGRAVALPFQRHCHPRGRNHGAPLLHGGSSRTHGAAGGPRD